MGRAIVVYVSESMLCQWDGCGQVFNTQLDLWTHITQCHFSPSRHECSYCSKVVEGFEETHLHAISQHQVAVSNEHWTYRDGEECFLDFWDGLGSRVLCSFLILSEEV